MYQNIMQEDKEGVTTWEKVERQLGVVHNWTEIERMCEENVTYLTGRDPRNGEKRFVLPIEANISINFSSLKQCIENINNEPLTLAIHGLDSATIFYEAQLGLKTPNVPAAETNTEEQNINPVSADTPAEQCA